MKFLKVLRILTSQVDCLKMTIVSMDDGPGVAALQAWSGQMAAYGSSNQTVVDKVPPELLHMIDPYWFVSIKVRSTLLFEDSEK